MSLSDEDEYELRQIDAGTEEYQIRVRESEQGRGIGYRQIPGKRKLSAPVLIFIVIFFILAFAYGIGIFDPLSTSTVTEKVIEKGWIATGRGNSIDLIYTLDQQIFEVNDNFFNGATNAQNIYNEIQVEHTYNMTVIGWDIPIFQGLGRGYRNIIHIEEVN
jgi:hypothetical protein